MIPLLRQKSAIAIPGVAVMLGMKPFPGRQALTPSLEKKQSNMPGEPKREKDCQRS
jgi:hypothetical protein